MLLLFSLASTAFAARPYESQLTEANSAPLANPLGLAVDNSDNLWVSDIDEGASTSTVSKFDSSGTDAGYLAQNDGTGSWGASKFVQGLAYGNSASLLYAADSNFDDLWGLNPDAGYAGVDLNTGLGGGCCFIHDAVDNSGNANDGDIYVSSSLFMPTNPSVLTRVDGSGAAVDFSASASYISANQLTGTLDHPFNDLRGVAVDAAGDVYALDKGENEVDQFDSTGTFLRAYTGSFGSISAVAVDPTNGDVLIGDVSQGVVHEFDSSGNFIADTDGSGTPDGSMSPQGLAVDSNGTLYVADIANPVVDVFGANLPSHTLTITTLGTGTVECRTTGSFGPCASYNQGETVTLKETPGSHFTFAGWSAFAGSGTVTTPCAGTLTQCEAKLDADVTGTATFAQKKPLVSNEEAGSIGQHAATLSGKVNPEGDTTTCEFDWGATASYGTKVPCTTNPGSGAAAVAVTIPALSGLSPNTTYHYRIDATNSGGATEGTDHTFTTSADTCATNAALCPPPVVTPPVVAPPVLTPPVVTPPKPLTCKKGFKKKKVHGKFVCQKIKHHHKKKHR